MRRPSSSFNSGCRRAGTTSRQLVDLYLGRIEQIDRSGPTLRSVIEVNPEARTIADALDAERKTRGPRGPLHGIPVLIKDNIDTADRMMTTAGSLALEGSIAARDAFVVERLRAAGAVILGKTNLSEWANFRSTKSSSGWSGRGGQTKNPYALDRNPCGSSSGTGAAIAANLAALGVGTETDGSIVCPSSVNGLVGIKPTVGLVSRSGIIPISHSQDTAGPMTRTRRGRSRAPLGDDGRRCARRGHEGVRREGSRLRKGPGRRCAQGRADWRRPQALLRLQPGRRQGDRRGHCRDEGARSGHRRSRGNSHRGDDR